MNISLQEYPVGSGLQPFIDKYWQATFNVFEQPHFANQIVPNGCIELIVHLSDQRCRLSRPGQTYQQSPPFTLMGVYPTPYQVQFPAGVPTFGIRFHPDGFRQVFGIPPGQFLASYEDATQVAGRQLQAFCSRIREAPRGVQQVQLANQFFSRQLLRYHQRHDYTHHAMQLIRQRQGLIGIHSLAQDIPIGLRQLQRAFKQHYGLTIRDYIRLSRLNTIRQYLMTPPASLTQLAYELGFTDQSHFIREFKHFTGLAPNGFLKQMEQFSANAVLGFRQDISSARS